MSGTLKIGGKTLATHNSNTNIAKIQLGSADDVVLADSVGNSILTENGSVVALNNVDTATIGSNALVVDSSGNVGIGTSSPTTTLFVVDSTTSGGQLSLKSNVSASQQEYIRTYYGGTFSGGIRRRTTYAELEFFSSSDRRIKTDIKPASGTLEKLMQVNVVNFKYRDSEDVGLLGVIAQELYEIFPESVGKTDDGLGEELPDGVEPWNVGNGNWNWVLIKAIQEQQTLIESQQSQIDDLTARIEALDATP